MTPSFPTRRSSDLWISVDPKVDYDKTLAAVQAAVDGYPGLVRDVQTYLKERIREVLTGSPTAITVRIFGEDLATLREKADEVKHRTEEHTSELQSLMRN